MRHLNIDECFKNEWNMVNEAMNMMDLSGRSVRPQEIDFTESRKKGPENDWENWGLTPRL